MTVRNSGVGPPRRPAPPSLACGSRCARRRPRDRGCERVPLDEPQQHPLHGPVAELDDPQFASREVGGMWADLAIKCATHSSGSNVGRKIRGRMCPRPIPIGFHAFHEPDFPPSQLRLCVAGFMTRFVRAGPKYSGPTSSPYSPECVEEVFSEVRIQDPAYPRPDRGPSGLSRSRTHRSQP
jgi:hypothetical protein